MILKTANRIGWLIGAFVALCIIGSGCDKLPDHAFVSPEMVHGVVKDMSDSNGCGLVIQLDNGTVIVPYQPDSTLSLAVGQEVDIAYSEMPGNSYSCSAGVVADVTWMEQKGCSPILEVKPDASSVSSMLPSDPFTITSAKINGDCLEILLSFSGGCQAHEFIMTYQKLPNFETYYGQLKLGHNSHDDMCEAYITQTVSFNLAPLKDPNKDMIRLVLVKQGDKEGYKLIIDYYYKK